LIGGDSDDELIKTNCNSSYVLEAERRPYIVSREEGFRFDAEGLGRSIGSNYFQTTSSLPSYLFQKQIINFDDNGRYEKIKHLRFQRITLHGSLEQLSNFYVPSETGRCLQINTCKHVAGSKSRGNTAVKQSTLTRFSSEGSSVTLAEIRSGPKEVEVCPKLFTSSSTLHHTTSKKSKHVSSNTSPDQLGLFSKTLTPHSSILDKARGPRCDVWDESSDFCLGKKILEKTGGAHQNFTYNVDSGIKMSKENMFPTERQNIPIFLHQSHTCSNKSFSISSANKASHKTNSKDPSSTQNGNPIKNEKLVSPSGLEILPEKRHNSSYEAAVPSSPRCCNTNECMGFNERVLTSTDEKECKRRFDPRIQGRRGSSYVTDPHRQAKRSRVDSSKSADSGYAVTDWCSFSDESLSPSPTEAHTSSHNNQSTTFSFASPPMKRTKCCRSELSTVASSHQDSTTAVFDTTHQDSTTDVFDTTHQDSTTAVFDTTLATSESWSTMFHGSEGRHPVIISKASLPSENEAKFEVDLKVKESQVFSAKDSGSINNPSNSCHKRDTTNLSYIKLSSLQNHFSPSS